MKIISPYYQYSTIIKLNKSFVMPDNLSMSDTIKQV